MIAGGTIIFISGMVGSTFWRKKRMKKDDEDNEEKEKEERLDTIRNFGCCRPGYCQGQRTRQISCKRNIQYDSSQLQHNNTV